MEIIRRYKVDTSTIYLPIKSEVLKFEVVGDSLFAVVLCGNSGTLQTERRIQAIQEDIEFDEITEHKKYAGSFDVPTEHGKLTLHVFEISSNWIRLTDNSWHYKR